MPQNLDINDKTIPVEGASIRLRLYSPRDEEPLPVIVFFHGGGFVIGDIEAYDGFVRDLCIKSKYIIVSVEYRLAPENPFPSAPKDCLAALQWVLDNIDAINGNKDEIYLAGDSAGGNLAAVTALNAREHWPGRIKGQILIYPVIDHYDPGTNSYRENAKGQGLTQDMMIWFWDQYYANSPLINGGETQHPLSTPLSVEDLSQLPNTLVITAEKDPLRDEGIAYAQRLVDQGVQVQHTLYKGLQHGFIGIAGPTPEHDLGMAEIVKWLDENAKNLPTV